MPSAIRKKSSSAATAATHSNTKQDDASNDPERRKLRNRMSQRAFRARQAMRIQELEGRLEHTSASDATWVTELQDQNARLREQLLHVHKKAIGMQISLKALADAAAQALGIDKVCALSSGSRQVLATYSLRFSRYFPAAVSMTTPSNPLRHPST